MVKFDIEIPNPDKFQKIKSKKLLIRSANIFILKNKGQIHSILKGSSRICTLI